MLKRFLRKAILLMSLGLLLGKRISRFILNAWCRWLTIPFNCEVQDVNGGIKRHNFKRGQMTHGSKSHRALGSIGAGTTPYRVYKGKKMPGRMGGSKRKIRKLKIVKIDNEL
ncbi:hypothetical protein PTKIN_Ptkin06aG0144000 [Pterospermum kingtungense]